MELTPSILSYIEAHQEEAYQLTNISRSRVFINTKNTLEYFYNFLISFFL